MNIIKKFRIFILILVLPSCSYNKPTFTLLSDVVEIPMIYTVAETRYFSTIVHNNDSVPVLIDTGCSISCLNNVDKKIKQESVKDARNIYKDVWTCLVEKLYWGGVKIENLNVLKTKNIVGNDILKNFCVQFDNDNSKILLSKNSNLINKKGIKIPFELDKRGLIIFKIQLNNKNTKIMLDTGSDADIRTDSLLLKEHNLKWIYVSESSSFANEPLPVNDTIYFNLADCRLNNKVIKNVMIKYNAGIFTASNDIRHTVGSQFLRRFKSVTIDFINKFLYFELPERDIKSNSFQFIFTDSEIDIHPIEYVNEFYSTYNSLGFAFSAKEDSTFFISGILLDSIHQTTSLEPFDTLVGVNQHIYYQEVFDRMKNKSNYQLELNRYKQKEITLVNIYNQNNVTFHFSKNGKIHTINAKRRQYVKEPPSLAYAYSFKPVDIYYYAINLYFDKKKTNISMHFPFEFLSHKTINITGTNEKGEKVVLNNKSKIKLQ